jgi:hypothetical protein
VKYERRSVGVFDALDRNNKQRLMRMRQMESFHRLARRPLANTFSSSKLERCVCQSIFHRRDQRDRKRNTLPIYNLQILLQEKNEPSVSLKIIHNSFTFYDIKSQTHFVNNLTV